jgi:hypothetical protein
MAYHPLANDTGGTADDRRSEADRLVKIIEEAAPDTMTQTEIEFVDRMSHGGTVSTKQLFWLRDIKDKYL